MGIPFQFQSLIIKYNQNQNKSTIKIPFVMPHIFRLFNFMSLTKHLQLHFKSCQTPIF